jgi:cytochrome c oxidase subunit IV
MTAPRLNIKTLSLVFLALWALVLGTSLIGFMDLGRFNIVVSVTIAAIQALLIAGFFMKVLYEGKVIHVILAGGVIWFLIMETLTLADYMSRGWLPFPGK